MKNSKYLIYIIISGVFMWSCSQEEEDVLTNPDFTPTTPIPPASAGSADFTKFVALGNSLAAGFQAAALFDEGQANSMPNIIHKSLLSVGSGDFNQPLINTANGFNTALPNPDPGTGAILGRLLLMNPANPAPGPTLSDVGALPDPSINPGFIFSDTTVTLNNFGVPGILLGQALIPQTGDWTLAGLDPRFNPFYARFASAPGTSTIIGDAATAQGTFFLFWLGSNDVLGYAVTGATGAIPLTAADAFAFQYGAAISVLTTDPTIQGVVGNIPDVTDIPFFSTVTWDAIPMDAAIAALSNAAYQSYNDGLDAAVALGAITPAENAARKIAFTASLNNAIVIEDEELTQNVDISLALGFPPGSVILPNIRQAIGFDLITLSAGAVLGTLDDPNDPTSVIGVGVALEDQYVLIPEEIALILDRTKDFNDAIDGTILALGLTDRVAVADMNAAFANLKMAGGGFVDGVLIAPELAPPAGLFSEDGVHPNSRGYAYAAQFFIEAINEKFGATIPLPSIANYSATGLPQ